MALLTPADEEEVGGHGMSKPYKIALLNVDAALLESYPADKDELALYSYDSIQSLVNESALEFNIIGVLGGSAEADVVETCRFIKNEPILAQIPLIVGGGWSGARPY